jgi:hypothetical protein
MAAANIAKFGEMQRGHPLKGAGQLKKRLPREIFGFLAFDRDYRSRCAIRLSAFAAISFRFSVSP